MIIESIFVIGLAILLDFKFGDPKNKYHPTAWIGTLIAKLTPLAKNENPMIEKFGGVCVVTITSGLVVTLLYAFNIGITLITIDYVITDCFCNCWWIVIKNYNCYSWNGKTCKICY